MPITDCLICRTEFYIKPSHQKKGWGKYCSSSCRAKAQLNGKYVFCYICNKQIYRSQKDLRSSNSGKFFCGKSCQTIWRNTILFTGENSANWIHGRSVYRKILERTNKDKICALCKANDFRVLIVHHKDKNRKNNNIDNLVWLCHNCHYLVHHYSDEQNKLKIFLKNSTVVVVQK